MLLCQGSGEGDEFHPTGQVGAGFGIRFFRLMVILCHSSTGRAQLSVLLRKREKSFRKGIPGRSKGQPGPPVPLVCMKFFLEVLLEYPSLKGLGKQII